MYDPLCKTNSFSVSFYIFSVTLGIVKMQLMTKYGGLKRLTPRMLKHLFVLTLFAVLLLGIVKMQLMTKYGGLKRLTPWMLKHLFVLTLIAVLLLGKYI